MQRIQILVWTRGVLLLLVGSWCAPVWQSKWRWLATRGFDSSSLHVDFINGHLSHFLRYNTHVFQWLKPNRTAQKYMYVANMIWIYFVVMCSSLIFKCVHGFSLYFTIYAICILFLFLLQRANFIDYGKENCILDLSSLRFLREDTTSTPHTI